MSELGALLRKNHRAFRNIRRVMESQSSLKVAFVTAFVALFEVGLFLLFRDGFRFLNTFEGLGALVINRLFSLFFLGMGLMLVISSVVTSYATIFRSEEVPFLLTGPFRISDVIGYKFLESMGLSSWAFFFIIVPFVAAYSWFRREAILFAFWTFLFSLPFLVLCSAIGVMLVLVVVRWVPRGHWLRLASVALAAAVGTGLWWLSRRHYDPSGEAYFNISRLIPGLQLAANALIPSRWVSEGTMCLSSGQWWRGGMLWCVLASSAMAAYAGVEWIGSRTFYESWQRMAGQQQRRERASILFTNLNRAMGFLPHDVRAMVLKDIRTFFRDPVQWSQALIFFGLLGLYFANLRSFNYHVRMEDWRNMLGFLNVFSVSAVMCSLGARFVYPQLSLEGQGFWVVGLSPTTMKRVLLTKFVVAVVSMSLIGLLLIVLSSVMLDMPRSSMLVAVGLVLAVSLTVCALSTGLGAVFLDLRQTNPSAIVSGFGGTLNLVISLGFMLAAIGPFSVIFHLQAVVQLTPQQTWNALIWATLWLGAITLLTTVVPLWLGARSLRKRDY